MPVAFITLEDGLSCYNCGKAFTLQDGKPFAKICFESGDESVGMPESFYLECIDGCEEELEGNEKIGMQ